MAGPYGHPIHPALAAVPIGAWVASVVFDIASRFVGDAAGASHAAWWLLAIGVLGALAAAMLGFLDLFGIPMGTRAFRVGLVHMSTVLTATVVFAVGWALRRGDAAPAGGTSAGYIALSVVGLVALLAGGYIGGELVFRYGVRVADEETQADGYAAREVAAANAFSAPSAPRVGAINQGESTRKESS